MVRYIREHSGQVYKGAQWSGIYGSTVVRYIREHSGQVYKGAQWSGI